MSRNTKIVLGIVGGLLLLCCGAAVLLVTVVPGMMARFAEGAIVEDPQEAATVGQSIIEYELPSGFSEEGAMSMFGTKMVFITDGDQSTVVMLMQFPAAVAMEEEQMRAQMEEAFSRQFNQRNYNLSLVESEEITINDKATTLLTYQGTDESGNEIRQVNAVFEAQDGATAMLMIMGPAATWDEDRIEQFVESLQ